MKAKVSKNQGKKAKNEEIDWVTTKYDYIKSLSRKRDCYIDELNTTVVVTIGKRAKNDLGSGSWGKIDFLCNKCGFTIVKTDPSLGSGQKNPWTGGRRNSRRNRRY